MRRGAHINGKLQSSWNKHGEDSFSFEIIAHVFNRDDLQVVEQMVLDDRSAVRHGYNLAPTAGNTSGWKASDETRKRMSDAAKLRDHSIQVQAMKEKTTGVKRPQYVLDAMLAARRAKPINAEGRMRMSESAKARGSNITPEHQARLVAMCIARGRFSDAQKREMSEMRYAGKTLKQIGAEFGISAETSVHANIKKWRAKQAENDKR